MAVSDGILTDAGLFARARSETDAGLFARSKSDAARSETDADLLQGQRLRLVCLQGQRLRLVCLQGPMPATFQCRCPRGYTGNLCEQVDACSGNPCLNGGTCTNQPLGVDTSSYLCTCLPGFTGNQCQTSTSSPSSSQCDGVVTCLNAGMCLSRADGSYMCQ